MDIVYYSLLFVLLIVITAFYFSPFDLKIEEEED
jgi:uncharacterized membrane protein